MIIKSRELTYLQDGSINLKVIAKSIAEHIKLIPRLEKLQKYYLGEHDILSRQKSNTYCANNKAVFNHAKNIVDSVLGYVFGQPISYEGLEEVMADHFTLIDEDSHNIELAKQMSIFGKAYELIYMDDEFGTLMPHLAVLSPLNTFIVYDNTVKAKPLFACTYTANEDIDGTITNYTVLVYTDTHILTFITKNIEDAKLQLIAEEQHMFDMIPILELSNNREQQGDFEPILGLIDLYNILMNDRVNDKEQLADSLLVISNLSLGDTEQEVSDTVQFIKDNRILELDDGGQAQYLTKSFNETEIEVLKKAIIQDIHKLSHIPNMADENFVGNSSGIAMKYKLLGFENLGITKERMFKQLLRKRLKAISNIEGLRGTALDLPSISIIMKRTLPIDMSERLSILQGTDGILSLRTRLQRYDEELDIDEELKRIEEEQSKRDAQMSQAFLQYNFQGTQYEPKQNEQEPTEDTEEDVEG